MEKNMSKQESSEDGIKANIAQIAEAMNEKNQSL
jgi:hypothetical protein